MCTQGGSRQYPLRRSSNQAKDDMQVFRLAGIIFLLTTFSFAQNVIDARGKSYSEINGYQGRYGTFGDPRHQKILSGILAITDARNLVAGSRFDYEIAGNK
jgi:hypothetical protein